jgi:hypothetical protein
MMGKVPKFEVPGLLKVMAWAPFGVTLFEGADGGPVPTMFVAATVNACAVPLVNAVHGASAIFPALGASGASLSVVAERPS